MPVILVLVLVGLTSLAAVAAVVSLLLSRLRRLSGDLREIERDVMPMIARLQRDADVTGRELERVSLAIDRLQERRGPR